MEKSRVTKLDPKGFKRILDIGGPSAALTTPKSAKPTPNKTTTNDSSNTAKTSARTKAPKSSRRLRRIVEPESDSSSSESADSDLASLTLNHTFLVSSKN
jgi:hypothetical protein